MCMATLNSLWSSSFLQNYCEDTPTNASGRRSKVTHDETRKTTSRSRREKAPPTSTPGTPEDTGVARHVRGFSDTEIRRFVKSYRKFGEPKSRYGPIDPPSCVVLLSIMHDSIILILCWVLAWMNLKGGGG